VHCVDGMCDMDFPFLHMAFDSMLVVLLDKEVVVHCYSMMVLETAVERAVVAAVGPYTVVVDTVTVELEIGVESSVVAAGPFVRMGYTVVVELETAVVPTIDAVGPHVAVVYAAAVELAGVADVGGPDAVWPQVAAGMVAILELALIVVDSAVVFEMLIIFVYLIVLEYFGVAAESLAEPVLPLSDHVPMLAVCLTSDFLALSVFACSIVECLVGHV